MKLIVILTISSRSDRSSGTFMSSAVRTVSFGKVSGSLGLYKFLLVKNDPQVVQSWVRV